MCMKNLLGSCEKVGAFLPMSQSVCSMFIFSWCRPFSNRYLSSNQFIEHFSATFRSCRRAKIKKMKKPWKLKCQNWSNSSSFSFLWILLFFLPSFMSSLTSKKLPNVYKSCPKIISLEKWKIFTRLLNMPKNVGDLGKIIVATGFKKLPKV